MSDVLPYRAMAHNNAWANHRLLTACARLSPDEFTAKRTGFFPSVRATLNHILIIDHFYVDAMEGGTLGPAAWADQEPCGTVAALKEAQAAVDRRLLAIVERSTELDCSASSPCIAAPPSSENGWTVCCCICSSTRCIIAGRRTPC